MLPLQGLHLPKKRPCMLQDKRLVTVLSTPACCEGIDVQCLRQEELQDRRN